MDMQHKTYDKEDDIQDIKDTDGKFLVLHNDDYHTFDYVIDALITICNHDEEQAVQCTYLVHYKGKADVKKGSYEELKPMMNGLKAKDLKATIE
jgi:ATP-dependent Clp protease adaptor protein ClpS